MNFLLLSVVALSLSLVGVTAATGWTLCLLSQRWRDVPVNSKWISRVLCGLVHRMALINMMATNLKYLKMETVKGYKDLREQKKQILYSRMDDTMIDRLREIRTKTGISVSEIIRESVRRLLQEVDETGSINLKI